MDLLVDGFDVVAVWICYEGAVGAVLGPVARAVSWAAPGGCRGLEERIDGCAVGGCEGEV
jgi:hypothetical protein